jgi:hypothetical protein
MSDLVTVLQAAGGAPMVFAVLDRWRRRGTKSATRRAEPRDWTYRTRSIQYELLHIVPEKPGEFIRVPAPKSPARRSRPANGLTKAAARVLPASDRARYAEEFSAELHDLALSGAGPLGQMLYGLRQVRGTLGLRIALQSPRRKGATP